MSILKLNAYIPSKGEYEKYFDKFRAFMSANVSEKAESQGVYKDLKYSKGWYPLRSEYLGYARTLWYATDSGNLVRSTLNPDSASAGLRVAFKAVYNPNSNIIKGCQNETRTTLVYDYGMKKNIKVTNSAPIVKFGGKDCIWLNKEDCESGKSKEMELWTLDLVEKAGSFDREGGSKDFAKAKEIISQCDRVLKEGCTKEELDMIVTIEMSSNYNYEKTTPCNDNEDNYDMSI